jgi:hypothetical protein
MASASKERADEVVTDGEDEPDFTNRVVGIAEEAGGLVVV